MPIKTDIRKAIATQIEGMTTIGGYNYDWTSSAFNRDLALSTFPNFYLRIPTEESLDFDTGLTNAQAYDNICQVDIIVHTKNSDSAIDPQWTNEDELELAEEDLKKLFADSGQQGSPLGNVGASSFMYMGYETEYFESNDIFVPQKRIFKFRLQYMQDRLDPSLVAC
jgi:hypothetical protein